MLELALITNLWCSLITAVSNVQRMAEVQDHIFCFIKLYKLIIVHMFQVQFLNIDPKVSTIQHVLHEWL